MEVEKLSVSCGSDTDEAAEINANMMEVCKSDSVETAETTSCVDSSKSAISTSSCFSSRSEKNAVTVVPDEDDSDSEVKLCFQTPETDAKIQPRTSEEPASTRRNILNDFNLVENILLETGSGSQTGSPVTECEISSEVFKNSDSARIMENNANEVLTQRNEVTLNNRDIVQEDKKDALSVESTDVQNKEALFEIHEIKKNDSPLSRIDTELNNGTAEVASSPSAETVTVILNSSSLTNDDSTPASTPDNEKEKQTNRRLRKKLLHVVELQRPWITDQSHQANKDYRDFVEIFNLSGLQSADYLDQWDDNINKVEWVKHTGLSVTDWKVHLKKLVGYILNNQKNNCDELLSQLRRWKVEAEKKHEAETKKNQMIEEKKEHSKTVKKNQSRKRKTKLPQESTDEGQSDDPDDESMSYDALKNYAKQFFKQRAGLSDSACHELCKKITKNIYKKRYLAAFQREKGRRVKGQVDKELSSMVELEKVDRPQKSLAHQKTQINSSNESSESSQDLVLSKQQSKTRTRKNKAESDEKVCDTVKESDERKSEPNSSKKIVNEKEMRSESNSSMKVECSSPSPPNNLYKTNVADSVTVTANIVSKPQVKKITEEADSEKDEHLKKRRVDEVNITPRNRTEGIIYESAERFLMSEQKEMRAALCTALSSVGQQFCDVIKTMAQSFTPSPLRLSETSNHIRTDLNMATAGSANQPLSIPNLNNVSAPQINQSLGLGVSLTQNSTTAHLGNASYSWPMLPQCHISNGSSPGIIQPSISSLPVFSLQQQALPATVTMSQAFPTPMQQQPLQQFLQPLMPAVSYNNQPLTGAATGVVLASTAPSTVPCYILQR